MRIIKAAVLILSLLAAAVSAEVGIIFKDDFRDNHNGWKEVFGLKDLKAVVENGKFVVNNNLMQTYLRQDGVLAGRAGFEIEAVFSNLKSEGGGDYGLKFDTVDQKNSYTFTINGKRQFSFSSMLDGNKIPAGPGKFSEHIRYDSNKLTVKCYNGTLDLLVNGKLLDVSDCAAAPWDRAGFIVSAKVAVDVDDFAVREPLLAAPDQESAPRAPRAAKPPPPLTAIKKEVIFQSHKAPLLKAADEKACDAAAAQARIDLANNTRLSDADLQAELDYTESVKAPPPAASPGAVCAVSGYKKALRRALEDRHPKPRKKRGPKKKH